MVTSEYADADADAGVASDQGDRDERQNSTRESWSPRASVGEAQNPISTVARNRQMSQAHDLPTLPNNQGMCRAFQPLILGGWRVYFLPRLSLERTDPLSEPPICRLREIPREVSLKKPLVPPNCGSRNWYIFRGTWSNLLDFQKHQPRIYVRPCPSLSAKRL